MKLASCKGFTLVELVVAVAVMVLLAALAFPLYHHFVQASYAAKCVGNMRLLGQGVLAYATENGVFPRSSHSAFAHRATSWSRAILPWVAGVSPDVDNAQWQAIKARYYRCPADQTPGTGQSYGLNVFFELDPEIDDYAGSPAQFRSPLLLARPASTILLAETSGNSDHVMAHFWEGGGDGADCAHDRHGGRANYCFADGSVRCLSLEEVYESSRGINLWNPIMASR